MKSTILLVDIHSPWLLREEVEYEGTKWDADTYAYALAEQFGLKPMKHHQTTVRFRHFITLWGVRGARSAAFESA